MKPLESLHPPYRVSPKHSRCMYKVSGKRLEWRRKDSLAPTSASFSEVVDYTAMVDYAREVGAVISMVDHLGNDYYALTTELTIVFDPTGEQ